MPGTRGQIPIQLREPDGDVKAGVSLALTSRSGGGGTAPAPVTVNGTSVVSGASRSSPVSFTRPAGAVAGHVAVVSLYLEDTSKVITPPAGFDEMSSTTQTGGTPDFRLKTYVGVLGAEAGPYDFTWASGSIWSKGIMQLYSGVDTTDPYTGVSSSGASPSATATVDSGGIVIDRDNVTLIWIQANLAGAGLASAPTGFTERLEGNETTIADDTTVTQGSTGAVTGTINSAQWNAGALFGLNGSGAPVTHYSAETGGTSSTAAIGPSDANGLFLSRWIPEGSYNAALSGGGITPQTVAIEIVRGDSVNVIADNAIGTAQLATGGVTTAKFPDNAITTAKLAASSVTEVKVATDNITTALIADNAVTGAKVASLAVTTAKFAADTVTQAEMQDDSVGTAELVDDAVTAAKVKDNSTFAYLKFASGAITNAKLANDAAKAQHLQTGKLYPPQKLASNVMPLGMILPYAGANAPQTWALANGALLDKTTYAALFALIGHTFSGGVDPGNNKFTLPDMRGRAPVHPNTSAPSIDTVGESDIFTGGLSIVRGPRHGHTIGLVAVGGGAHSHTGIASEITPGQYVGMHGAGTWYKYYGNTTTQSDEGTAHSHGGPTGLLGDLDAWLASEPMVNAAPYLTVNYIIKIQNSF